MRKYVFVVVVFTYANDKGVDQPTHSRSLMGALAIRCLCGIQKTQI